MYIYMYIYTYNYIYVYIYIIYVPAYYTGDVKAIIEVQHAPIIDCAHICTHMMIYTRIFVEKYVTYVNMYSHLLHRSHGGKNSGIARPRFRLHE